MRSDLLLPSFLHTCTTQLNYCAALPGVYLSKYTTRISGLASFFLISKALYTIPHATLLQSEIRKMRTAVSMNPTNVEKCVQSSNCYAYFHVLPSTRTQFS
jgi:hypothetical protein